MSVGPFAYDVFISHSSKDKPVVYELAERLKADGLRVWLDAWEIRPGDNIPSKIEEGLECSSVLLLCMSANAFGSDWAALENQTFRFRDPLNKAGRFITSSQDWISDFWICKNANASVIGLGVEPGWDFPGRTR